ncbi:MAG: PA14 domain-containing protein [Kiritimatiellaeota bacterium]|nr:PA14 domain-containing protein [Kiritimatiellota bacterium]
MNMKCMVVCGVLACALLADAQVLTWDGAGGAKWDASSVNWLDESSQPSAWVPGAVAKFDGGGGFVEVAADVSAGGITFASGGYTLAGYGRIRLEGDLFVAGGATNSVGAEIFSASGIAKTGLGAVALGQCVGKVTVSAGDLLAMASQFADAQVAVSAGARIVTAGAPRAGNLVLDGGFEMFGLDDGTFRYADNAAGLNLGAWVTAMPDLVAGQNVATKAALNSPGTATEGVHALALQYNGVVAQTVAVAQGGWHQIAFDHFLRRGYAETLVFVTLDDAPVALLLNDAVESNACRFVSVPFWLAPGAHTLGLAGEGFWGDRMSIIDDVVLAPAFASAAACLSLGGDSEVALAAGAAAVLGHSGTLGVARLDVNGGASVTGAGAWAETVTGLWFEYANSAWAPPLAMGEDALLRFREDASEEVEGVARRVWVSGAPGGVALTGEGLTLMNTAAAGSVHCTVSDLSAVTVGAPMTLSMPTLFDIFGSLTFADNVSSNMPFFKRGFGEMTLTQPIMQQVGRFTVLEGRVSLNHINAQAGTSTPTDRFFGGYIWAQSQPGRVAEVRLTQPDVTHALGVVFAGSGRAVVTTALGGRTVSIGHPRSLMPTPAEFLVPGGDTLSIRQLLYPYSFGRDRSGGLLKSGPGVLEIREGGYDTGNSRAHTGRVILRNGTLRVLADDVGNLNGGTLAYNGMAPSGRGGSLGLTPFSTAMWIGDDETQPLDDLTFTAAGNKRYIGRDIEVFDVGNDVRFEVENSTDTLFDGTLTLHRGVTFAGANDAHLRLNRVTGAGSAVALALEGFSHVTVSDTLDGGIDLDIGGRTLVIGPEQVAVAALGAFAANGATLDINLAGGTCSRIEAGDATLGAVAFNLYYLGSKVPFAEPGVYTLVTCSGTLTVNINALSVANEMPGFAYAFSAAGGALTLTIQSDTPATFTAWAHAEGGPWDTGANWNPATAPDDAALSVLMGGAITNAAEVVLNAPYTVGSLMFNNPLLGYTLDGDALTLGRIDVLTGPHTIKNALVNSGPLAVAVAGGKLTLGGSATVLPQVLLEQGTLTVGGADVTLAASIEGAAGTALAFEDGAKATVSLPAGGTFSGALKGPAGAALVKDGPGLWTLDGYDSLYFGAFSQALGNTRLEGVSLFGPVTTEAGTALTVAPAATDGLMGYYYHIGDRTTLNSYSNAFLSVATLEAVIATRTPDLISPSGLDGENFDYPIAENLTLRLPYPFGTDGVSPGPCQYDFIAVWRGSITLPESGRYSFTLQADDFPLVVIDGNVLFSNNRCENATTTYASAVELGAGRHDIFIGLGQGGGVAGIRLLVHCPSDEIGQAHIPIPNSWLSPVSALGSINGAGAVAVQANASAIVGAKGASVVNGTLTTGAGSLLTKAGGDLLDLPNGAANQIAGAMTVLGGKVTLTAQGQLAAASRVVVGSGATLAVQAPQAISGLEGRGNASLGGADEVCVDMFAFTDESDSGISDQKTYTHAVSMPTSEAGVTVNGVPFTTGDAGWVRGPNFPTSTAGPNGGNTSMEQLLNRLYYNQTDYTFTLTGLQPFTAHEFRIYNRAYTLNDMRMATYTFSVNEAVLGSVSYNEDSIVRSIVRCRYITDAAGTLTVRVQSFSTATAHLYAFSNEVIGRNIQAPGEVTLTLSPPAGAELSTAAPFFGSGTVVKDGAGLQRFGGANTAHGGLTVLDGEAVLSAGASVASGLSIAPGAGVTVPNGHVALGGLSGGGGTFDLPSDTIVRAQGIYIHYFTNDVQTQISPAKTYTHALDFGNRDGLPADVPGAEVNGVTFLKARNSGSSSGYGWSGIGRQFNHVGNTAHGNVIADDQAVYQLLRDMVWENVAGDVGTLTGLTPGKTYEVRFYNRWWGVGGNRSQTVHFVTDATENTVSFNVDGLYPHFLAYRYTAPASGTLNIIFYPEVSGSTWHIYALTNEEVDEHTEPLPAETATVPQWEYPEETLYQRFFTCDADTQISTLKRYTHKLDFGVRGGTTQGKPGATVNGVTFVKGGPYGTTFTEGRLYGWRGFGGGNGNHGGGNAGYSGIAQSQGLYALLTDMTHNTQNATAYLTGLTPGKQYEVRIYNRTWDMGNVRTQTATFTAGPGTSETITFDLDRLAAHFLAYRYTAPADGRLTIQYTSATVATWHIYALTNEEVYDPAKDIVIIDVANRTDTFGGDVTGGQRWEKRGNGTLLLTGNSTATGPLTVRGGALGVDLNGIATLGPVLVQDALLFGHGTFGGDVFIASNAWLHAGTPAACGLLTVGGRLTLEDDARLDWRYGAKPAADTFAVGALTLPAEGTFHTAPLAPGATPPAKHVVFDSATPINGPADLSGWDITDIKGAKLEYNTARTQILFRSSRGTIIMLR